MARLDSVKELVFEQGKRWMDSIHFHEAIECFTAVLSTEPSSTMVLYLRSKCYLAIDKFSAALEDARGIRMAKGSRFPQAVLIMGKVLAGQRNWDAAIDKFKEILSKDAIHAIESLGYIPLERDGASLSSDDASSFRMQAARALYDAIQEKSKSLTVSGPVFSSYTGPSPVTASTSRVTPAEKKGITFELRTVCDTSVGMQPSPSIQCMRGRRQLLKALDAAAVGWPIEFQWTPTREVGVFAKQRIKAGAVIFEERAAVSYVKDPTRCHNCAKLLGETIVRCPGICGKRFCSETCHVNAKKTFHTKAFCDRMLVLELYCSKTESTELLLALKVLFGALQQPTCASKDKNALFVTSLLGHLHRSALTAELAEAMQRLSIVKDALGHDGMERLGINASDMAAWKATTHSNVKYLPHDSEVTASKARKLPVPAIFYRTSFLNHSCKPNAEFRCNVDADGDVGRVVALHRIEKGEEIEISYIPSMGADTSLLKTRFGFTCACKKCLRSR
jgi:tetratricopeptide (TPR) repeat protein